MEPTTDNPFKQPTDAIWVEAFADAFLVLVKGEGDIHDLHEWGFSLWSGHRERDPAEVARDEFLKENP